MAAGASPEYAEEHRSRLLVASITDYAIFMLDANGTVTSWNPGAEKIKGYEPHQIIGRHFSCFYTEEDRASGLPAQVLRTAAAAGKFEAEGWRVRKDGSRFWAYVVVDPIIANGAVIGFAKVTRDLTERREAEEQLRRSREQFRILVQGVTDYAIYMLDSDGRVTNWNAGAERIKGYAPDEIIGEHFSRFYTDEDRASGQPARSLAIARAEGKFETEAWRVRKDGTRFFAHVVIDAIHDDSGALIGFAKITRDITERMEAQRSLEKTREALLQSQKMESIGRLTGGIAHDFNNLLMVVLSSLELMRKRLPDDQKLHGLLETAMQGAQRGSTLTRRMLAFARRQDLKQEPVSVPALVRGMTDMLQRSLGPAIAIETRFPLVSRPAMVDSNQLEMAILNLAVNARDAMPEGGQIIIAARERSAGPEQDLQPGTYICLSVADTGTGMDAKTLEQAMEPFFTTKGPGKGTGLGLPMVLGLAEQSGGRFTLASRAGEGTTAELWLPLAAAEAPATAPAAPEPVIHTRTSTATLSILAVDDDPLILMNTAAMLEDLGHTAIAASSAKQALEILNGGLQVDLVISDQAMPQMTGAQLAATIKRQRPHLPFVIATGYAELEGGQGAGVVKLSKPFDEQQLKTLIDGLFPPNTVVAFPRERSSD